MSQPLLSIGMIVKNEERCLEKCLKALEPLRQAIPCELVIADTGSTDKTKDIAAKYADTLFDFTWGNDFSKARNAVMDKCSGKWYLTVDADEYLCSDTYELVNFLNTPLSSEKTFATIIIRNYNDIEMIGVSTDFNALRMVRMDTKKRYEGTIHESFVVTDLSQIFVLSNTVFGHDGYTAVTANHLKEKSNRNLILLEEKLSRNPNDLECILQCLESSVHNPKKKQYYIDYSFNKITENTIQDSTYMKFIGPPLIRTIINYAISEKNTAIENYIDFAFSIFPKSFHVLIDVNYLYANFLYERKNFEKALIYSKAYFKNLEIWKKQTQTISTAEFFSPINSTHINHQLQIRSIIINSYIELNKINEAKEEILTFDLSNAVYESINNFILAIANYNCTPEITKIAGKMIENVLEQYYNQTSKSTEQYNSIIKTISNILDCSNSPEYNINNFETINGTIGLCIKIARANSKEEIEKYLNQVKNWEEIMPIALKKAIALNATLPKEFFCISYARMNFIIKNLTVCINDIANSFNNFHFINLQNKSWNEISFYFNLLSTVLTDNEIFLDKKHKSSFIKSFLIISNIYLNDCYNNKILENEKHLTCIPTTHLLSWCLVNATKFKDSDPLMYVKALKATLNKVPQAKSIIEFLIDDFKKEQEKQEEQKRQEKIKNTSPELIAMAEQLKTMLTAFPPNSPELLAIKQSPMYKQVEFLIED